MTTNIVIKDAAGLDKTFTVVRQPQGSASAILYGNDATPGMNRTGLVKIELSSRVVNGRTTPTASVVVPYGAVVNGNFVKAGQVAETISATQPADAPDLARQNAEAFGRNLLADAQVMALFSTGLI